MQKLSGSLGNLWKKWTVKMANRTDPYQIVIEATVGKPGMLNCGFFFIYNCHFLQFLIDF